VKGAEMPSSLDAEKGLLGSIMLAPTRVLDELTWLSPAHFYHPAHAMIFRRIVAMREARVPIDLLSVTQALEDAKRETEKGLKTSESELEVCGGAAFVTELFTFVPSAVNAAYYGEIVNEKFTRRGLILSAWEQERRARDETDVKVEEILDQCDQAISQLRTDTTYLTSLKHLREILPEVSDEIEERHKHRGKTFGLPTGLVDLDRTTAGLEKGQLIIIGARPSDGKTSLMLQIAENISRAHGPVAIFSMEMTARQLGKRLLCMDASVDLLKVRTGMAAKVEMAALAQSYHKLVERDIYIDERPALTIMDFRAASRRAVAKNKAIAICVDYLQLMRSLTKRAKDSRVVEIAEVSMAIKAMAKELDVPIICCAQLNREAKGTDRPKSEELKDSGQIEQDADMIILIHRLERDNENDDGQEMADLVVAKQKDGPTAAIEVGFNRHLARFESLTDALFSNDPRRHQKARQGKSEEGRRKRQGNGQQPLLRKNGDDSEQDP
jgi:replicative DNA helicase